MICSALLRPVRRTNCAARTKRRRWRRILINIQTIQTLRRSFEKFTRRGSFSRMSVSVRRTTLVGSAAAAAARARVEPLKISSRVHLPIVVPTDGIMPAIVPPPRAPRTTRRYGRAAGTTFVDLRTRCFTVISHLGTICGRRMTRRSNNSAHRRRLRTSARCFEAPLLVSPRLSSHCMASDGSLPTCHSSFHQH